MVHCRLARIIERVYVAAACFLGARAAAGIIPGFHGNAHHFIILLMKHQGHHGTVNTAAHGYQNFPVTTHFLKKISCKINPMQLNNRLERFRKGEFTLTN
jgi:hypothetical protein